MWRERVAFPVILLILGLACAAGTAVAQTADEELLSLTGVQPALAADVRGGFAVIWTDTEAENEGMGIRGCLLAPKDAGCGPHFAVNTTAIGDQTQPAVAADDPGRFVVAWQGPVASAAGEPLAGVGIFGQRFGAGGVKLGSELVLARPEEGNLLAPKLALGDDGGFVAVWQSEQAGRSGIEAARFSAKGKPVGQAIPMEAEGESNNGASVATYPGGFAVAWHESFERSGGRPDSSFAALARFDPAGRPVGKVERLDGLGLDALVGSRAGALAVFADLEGPSAQRLAASGEAKEGRFPLSRDFLCSEDRCETAAAVAMDTRGRFVVIWEVTEHGTISSLFAQLFTPAGKPRTERIPVSSAPSQGSETPAVALANDGTVLVAWTRMDTVHPERSGLYLRRLRMQ
ncbi:MAG TPA: hypothetical protein VF173_20205 [Thermoanaerobaculia bacterium]|nr:hypothetical protein [Thermoanaerobaculia bacterium]